jgi:hypothetical protein
LTDTITVRVVEILGVIDTEVLELFNGLTDDNLGFSHRVTVKRRIVRIEFDSDNQLLILSDVTDVGGHNLTVNGASRHDVTFDSDDTHTVIEVDRLDTNDGINLDVLHSLFL